MAPRLIAKYSDFVCVFEGDAATTEGADAGVYNALVMADTSHTTHLCALVHSRSNENTKVHDLLYKALSKVINFLIDCFLTLN